MIPATSREDSRGDSRAASPAGRTRSRTVGAVVSQLTGTGRRFDRNGEPFRHRNTLPILIVIAVLASMMGGGSNSTSEGGGEAASQGETSSSDEAAKVGLGQEFTVGDWATTVESVDTPVASVGPSGFSTEAQGEFVPVQISAKNNAKEERTFFADSVKLVSADGAEYSYSTDASIYGTENGMNIEPTNPGNVASGYLWFDVPAGTEITQVKVSGGGLSLDQPVVVELD